jgi:hypothetical protein
MQATIDGLGEINSRLDDFDATFNRINVDLEDVKTTVVDIPSLRADIDTYAGGMLEHSERITALSTTME